MTILRTPVRGAAAWRPHDLGRDDDWVLRLSPAQVDELLRAVDGWSSRGLAPGSLTRAHAELPLLSPLLAQAGHALRYGRGFAVLRGLPVERWSVDEAALAYWALGTHLGEGVSQSAAGDLLGHVCDIGPRTGYAAGRGYLSNAQLPFHTDHADLVGLMCYRKARSGGESLLASSATIYNTVLAEHPEYLETYYRGFYWTRNDEQDAQELPHSGIRIPVFTYAHDQLSCRYGPSSAERGEAMVNGAASQATKEAIAFISEVAWREDVAFMQTMEPGDAQFLNNYLVVHSRRGFDDWEDERQRRLLLRLWLRVPGIREFGAHEHAMRDVPLIYGNQGRTPDELRARGLLAHAPTC